MKTCNKCKEEKQFEDFNIDKKSKDGYRHSCKICTKKQSHINYLKNKTKINKKSKKYRHENKEKLKIYYQKIKPHRKKIQKEYRDNNKEKISYQKKEYYINNKEEILYKRKLDKLKISKYLKKRKDENPIIKLTSTIRTSIYSSIKRNGFSKNKNTQSIIGCSFEEFKFYLESKFEIWMTWDNYGKYNGDFNFGWDIDHIIPVSKAKNESDIIEMNHFSNLQPLCSRINRVIKRNK